MEVYALFERNGQHDAKTVLRAVMETSTTNSADLVKSVSVCRLVSFFVVVVVVVGILTFLQCKLRSGSIASEDG